MSTYTAVSPRTDICPLITPKTGKLWQITNRDRITVHYGATLHTPNQQDYLNQTAAVIGAIEIKIITTTYKVRDTCRNIK